jgi:hypothetical protein
MEKCPLDRKSDTPPGELESLTLEKLILESFITALNKGTRGI